MAGGSIFVTNCEPELLTWEAVVALYRVADRTYVQTLEVAQPARDTPRRRGRGGAIGSGYVKLIAVLVQHWIS